MTNDMLFGVRDRASDEVLWCAVLGNSGEFIGLALYFGDDGFDQYLRLCNGLVDDHAALGQNGLLISFGERRRLKQVALERINSSGVAFRGPEVSPQVELKRVGYDFEPVDARDVRRLIDALQQVLATTSAAELHPEYVEPDDENRFLVRAIVDGCWADTRVDQRKAPDPELRAVDRERIAALRKRAVRLADRFEFDVFPFRGGKVRGGGTAFIPATLLLVDSHSEMVDHASFERPEDRQRAAAAQLSSAFEKHGVVPRTMAVRRPELAYGVHKTLDALGIQDVAAKKPPALDRARESLSAGVKARGPAWANSRWN